MNNTEQIAKEFTQLCTAGKFEQAGQKFWSDDVVSIEPPGAPADIQRIQGRKAVDAKGKWFSENHQVHDVKVEGPFVNGDEFAVRFEMEMTPKGKSRVHMTEVGLYRVKNGKVVEEKFFTS